jgi:hypothetical protein
VSVLNSLSGRHWELDQVPGSGRLNAHRSARHEPPCVPTLIRGEGQYWSVLPAVARRRERVSDARDDDSSSATGCFSVVSKGPSNERLSTRFKQRSGSLSGETSSHDRSQLFAVVRHRSPKSGRSVPHSYLFRAIAKRELCGINHRVSDLLPTVRLVRPPSAGLCRPRNRARAYARAEPHSAARRRWRNQIVSASTATLPSATASVIVTSSPSVARNAWPLSSTKRIAAWAPTRLLPSTNA